jgi:hypothetical protein
LWFWRISYHVESHDILERNFASAMTLHEDLVDKFRAAASRQTKHKGLLSGRLE